jgi:hypothetical protein
MANAIPAGIGEDQETAVKKQPKEEKVKQKDVLELPKAQSKVTLPDGTVIETY